MPRPKPPITKKPLSGFPRIFCLLLLGTLLGAIAANFGNPLPLSPREQFVPYPYAIPKLLNATSLRLAMVHDILHERYLRHGPAWNEKQLQNTTPLLPTKNTTQATPQQLDAMDDHAVALILLHREPQAITLMRQKLALLPDTKKPSFKSGQDYFDSDIAQIQNPPHLTPTQHQLYSAHANLGTALIHASFQTALSGNTHSRTQLTEGLNQIEQAIALNPLAHFGRENWQAIAVSHFLACLDHPDLITKYALTGQPLHPNPANDFFPLSSSTGRFIMRHYADISQDQITTFDRAHLRKLTPAYTFPQEWASLTHSPYIGSTPFDEPTLAIIGMWTLGGGPNPHFALSLGRLMESAHQHYIAWNAYQRAIELSENFWPTPDIREKLTAYCRSRQKAIASILAPNDPAAWESQMLNTHTSELAWGQQYQHDYQQFEATQINSGIPLDSPHFYDPFFAHRPSIASPVGHADEYLLTFVQPQSPLDYLPCITLACALCLLLDTLRSQYREKHYPLITSANAEVSAKNLQISQHSSQLFPHFTPKKPPCPPALPHLRTPRRPSSPRAPQKRTHPLTKKFPFTQPQLPQPLTSSPTNSRAHQPVLTTRSRRTPMRAHPSKSQAQDSKPKPLLSPFPPPSPRTSHTKKQQNAKIIEQNPQLRKNHLAKHPLFSKIIQNHRAKPHPPPAKIHPLPPPAPIIFTLYAIPPLSSFTIQHSSFPPLPFPFPPPPAKIPLSQRFQGTSSPLAHPKGNPAVEQPLASPSTPLASTSDPAPAAPRNPYSLQDAQTLSQLRRGNWSAMEELVHRYQDRLFNVILRIVAHPDDAADLVQETFVRAIQNVSKFEGKSTLYTWLFRIAVNLSLSHRRAAKYRHTTPLDADSDASSSLNRQAAGLKLQLAQHTELDPAADAETRIEHERLLLALASLEPDTRAIIILRDIEECDYQQIGDILNLPLGTVKSRLFRARTTLRELLSTDSPQHEDPK